MNETNSNNNNNIQANNNLPAIMRCRLRKSPNGFGFSVKQRSTAPTLSVGELTRNGEAEKSGLIRPGDIIIRINDIDVSQCSYLEALDALMSIQKDSFTSFVIRAPIGYTTRLETTFASDGTPKTLRITEKIVKSMTEKETSVETKFNSNDILCQKRGSGGNKEALNLANDKLNESEDKDSNCSDDKQYVQSIACPNPVQCVSAARTASH